MATKKKTPPPPLTAGPIKTPQSRATLAAMRNAEERRAEFLRSRGWTCTPPQEPGTRSPS